MNLEFRLRDHNYLTMPQIIKPLKGQKLLLRGVKVSIDLLSLVDSSRSQSRNAHSVADEDDDVFGHAVVDGGDGL